MAGVPVDGVEQRRHLVRRRVGDVRRAIGAGAIGRLGGLVLGEQRVHVDTDAEIGASLLYRRSCKSHFSHYNQ